MRLMRLDVPCGCGFGYRTRLRNLVASRSLPSKILNIAPSALFSERPADALLRPASSSRFLTATPDLRWWCGNHYKSVSPEICRGELDAGGAGVAHPDGANVTACIRQHSCCGSTCRRYRGDHALMYQRLASPITSAGSRFSRGGRRKRHCRSYPSYSLKVPEMPPTAHTTLSSMAFQAQGRQKEQAVVWQLRETGAFHCCLPVQVWLAPGHRYRWHPVLADLTWHPPVPGSGTKPPRRPGSGGDSCLSSDQPSVTPFRRQPIQRDGAIWRGCRPPQLSGVP